MAWKQEHKQQTRQKILDSAGELFTHQGFDGVNIDRVMANAGLTRGAFYAHFKSKSELYAQAIIHSATAAHSRLTEGLEDKAQLNAVAERYLSMDHKNGAESSCPLAFLATDIHQRDSRVRNTYTKVFKGFLNNLAQTDGKDSFDSESIQQAVMMIGGLALARAVNDDQLSEIILAACRKGLEKNQ